VITRWWITLAYLIASRLQESQRRKRLADAAKEIPKAEKEGERLPAVLRSLADALRTRKGRKKNLRVSRREQRSSLERLERAGWHKYSSNYRNRDVDLETIRAEAAKMSKMPRHRGGRTRKRFALRATDFICYLAKNKRTQPHASFELLIVAYRRNGPAAFSLHVLRDPTQSGLQQRERERDREGEQRDAKSSTGAAPLARELSSYR